MAEAVAADQAMVEEEMEEETTATATTQGDP